MEKEILKLKEAISQADTILIGAGAGLSTSAGFTYTGERFEKHFADFHQKYGFTDMYSGGFYPYKTLEENWAFWSRYIWINRYMVIINLCCCAGLGITFALSLIHSIKVTIPKMKEDLASFIISIVTMGVSALFLLIWGIDCIRNFVGLF